MGDAVFSVQAIMTLQDLISGKLTAIAGKLAATGHEAAGLGVKMAALAKAMLPVAAVAGAVLLGLGGAVAKAASFEQAMSKVKAVSAASAEDMAALRKNALQMGADTSFSALEAAGAQEDLAKAGLNTTQIIAAMPGVLAMAAAGDISLSQAAEAATDTMKTFHLEASQIGYIGDIMAATANKTSTDIGLMTQSLKNSSAVAASVSVSLLDLSAMIGSLADQGIKGAEAGTQLKTAMLRISAPNKDAAKLFAKLGVATRDAKGNILPIFDVLGSLEKKLAGMSTGKRADILKKIFGDDAISAVSALFNAGIDKVKAFSKELAGSSGSAAETAAIKLDNLKGALESLRGSFETLLINVGDPLLKPLTMLVQGITKVVNGLNSLAETEAGRTLVTLAGAAASAVIASTVVAAGMWAMSLAGAAASWALAPLGAALGALGAPIWVVIGLIAVLVLAWKTNFGGMQTTITAWWNKIVLVVKGVAAVFGSLSGSTGELKGQLAKDIEAKGLLGVVTKVGKIIFRIRQYYVSLWEAFRDGVKNIGAVFAPLASAFDPIINALSPLWGWFKKLLNIGVNSKLSTWAAAGRLVGTVLGVAFRLLAMGVRATLVPLQMLAALFGFVIGLFTGKGGSLADLGKSFGDIFSGLWASFEAAFPQVAIWLQKIGLQILMWIIDLGYNAAQKFAEAWQALTAWLSGLDIMGTLSGLFAGVGEAIMGALSSAGAALSSWWDGVTAWFASLDPVGWITNAFAGVGEALSTAFSQVTSFFSSIDLSACGAAIIDTISSGVMSKIESLKGKVSSALAEVRNLLPFSDAKEGPLSALTASGRAIMTTLATGVTAAGPALAGATGKAMAGAAATLTLDTPANLPDLTGTASWRAAPPPDVSLPDTDSQSTANGRKSSPDGARGGKRIVIQNLSVTLPNVSDADGFGRALQRLVEQYDA